MSSRIRHVLVVAALAAAPMIGLASPAQACACGGVVSPDASASVADETALVRWNGYEETIVLKLGLESDADNAALVVPTPTPARVAAGKTATFDELQRLTAPRVETKNEWWEAIGTSSPDSDGATAAAPLGSAPHVLAQVQLGPLEATTLAGGDLTGLQTWLSTNGYAMKPEVTQSLAPYVSEGWAFVAMRLTSTKPLNGDLDPVQLTFASDHFVYPMRMSAAATKPQSVRIYALADRRVERRDVDAQNQQVRTTFAGPIAHVEDPDLAALVGDGTYLTSFTTYIGEPSKITSDFLLGPAKNGDDYQQVTYVRHEVRILGIMAGPFLTGVALFVLVDLFVLSWVIRRGRSRRAERA
ncbi:DUF2330 domain-containing protein [Antrihabitans stalactiti]|uniref:DUF2330 domain-containing protein n=1 Tax=Antrihabitans stalactiti TaxID=2584121 RepID=UPI00197D1646|nr:DUF2330 domain-containing protein [Antrihabitans stalactiti]